MKQITASSSGEHGAVLAMFALWLPMLVLVAALAIDVSNWFVHKRHLQMQADAAALAGAGDFSLPDCATADVQRSTETYSGIDPAAFGGTSTYNAQVGGTSPRNVHLAINSDSYLGSSDPELVIAGNPCTQMYIDTKLTESNLPWLLQATKIVPGIHAHARVSILQETTTSGALPIAVPDVKPKRVRVTFIDESTGSELGHSDLSQRGTSGADAVWDNLFSPVTFPIDKSNIEMRVAISGSDANIGCGQPLVQCYDATSSTTGVVYVRGWSQDDGGGKTPSQSAGNPPLLQDVNLTSGSCNDAYFTNNAPCTVGVRAHVNWGVDGPNPTSIGGKVTATMGGQTDTLTYNTGTRWWESATDLQVATGPTNLTMAWAETSGTYNGSDCSTSNGNKCKGDFNPDSNGNGQPVQRAYGAYSDGSGPIDLATISNDGGTTWGTDSFEECSSQKASCPQSLTVQLAIKGGLGLAQPGDPPVSLRVAGSGSLHQSLDCDPSLTTLKQELAQGCAPQYTKNDGSVDCSSLGQSLSALSKVAQPWPCVAVSTGAQPNDVSAGLNQRILCSQALGDGGNCTTFGKASLCTEPNHWANYGTAAWNENDPRIVQVYLTPFGTFNGSGQELVPVTDFATFYITGWTGQGAGFNNPCQGNGDDPVPNNDPGVIVGHFITYLDHFSSGDEAVPCDPLALTPCVAELTQ